VHVARLLTILDCLPDVSDPSDISVSLGRPDKWFGEHRISHSWDVRIDSELIEVSSGGYFYRESTGGDSFTSMMWSISPGEESEFSDFLDRLTLVDDAVPFESEVHQLNLDENGYSLTVYVDGEEIEAHREE